MGITGIDVNQEIGLKQVLVLREGDFDALAKPNTILIFDDQAADLEVKVGDQVTISAPTPRGTNNTVDVTVVAIAKSMGLMSSFASFMNAETLRQLYQLNEETTGALQVYLPTADMVVVKQVEERLRGALEKSGYQVMEDDPRAFFFKFENVTREAWTGQKLDVTSWRDEVSFVSWTVDLMNAMAFVVAFLLLVIVGIGIMNVMWIAIRERTREIGTLRAIGMQRPHVLAMFVVEGFLLALFSTTFGAALGAAIAYGINSAAVPLPLSVQLVVMSDHLIIIPTAQWALTAMIFITVIVTVISIIPALIAARLKPITAMAHAG
jgi:ABC-type lipoprotein release transport system permease subunit